MIAAGELPEHALREVGTLAEMYEIGTEKGMGTKMSVELYDVEHKHENSVKQKEYCFMFKHQLIISNFNGKRYQCVSIALVILKVGDMLEPT